ncbi:MAG: YraN family protein [Flammeovirgaceae bacterium]
MNSTPPKKRFGNWAEKYAEQFLKNKNFQILERNYRFKHAEIDLITQYQNTIVFIEVKARSSTAFGYPEETVSQNQKKSIKRAAVAYLESKQLNVEIRFDIISILRKGNWKAIYHVEDAFY